jgi:hypothetical protein
LALDFNPGCPRARGGVYQARAGSASRAAMIART